MSQRDPIGAHGACATGAAAAGIVVPSSPAPPGAERAATIIDGKGMLTLRGHRHISLLAQQVWKAVEICDAHIPKLDHQKHCMGINWGTETRGTTC